jgi:hypothetical protein
MRVETQPPAKPANDVAKHLAILLAGVWIVGGHDTTPTEVGQTDLRVRQSDGRSRPITLRGTGDALDEEVRAQPPDIAAEHRDHSVGADEQRQDIETLRAIEPLQPRTRPDCCFDALSHVRRIPGQSVHERLTVGAEHRAQPQQSRERSRRDDTAASIVDLHDTIAHQSGASELGPTQALAGHRFHWISPDRRDSHRCQAPARAASVASSRSSRYSSYARRYSITRATSEMNASS